MFQTHRWKHLISLLRNQTRRKMDHFSSGNGVQATNSNAEPVKNNAADLCNVKQKQKHSVLCTVTQENMRMRQTIDQTTRTMNQWIRQTQQQTGSFIKLMDTLKASMPNQNNSRHDLDAMIKQMKDRESRWAQERLAFEDMQKRSTTK